jgi:hypothetical protein
MITFNSGVLTQNMLSGPGIRKIFHSVVSETECCANSSSKGMENMLQRLFFVCEEDSHGYFSARVHIIKHPNS